MTDERDGKDTQESQPKDGKVFTVEEAASILGCRRTVVYDMIAEGWLNRPSGGTKKETGGRVTQKSLYQFVIVDRLRGLPPKTLKELRHRRKPFEKSASANGEANCLSMSLLHRPIVARRSEGVRYFPLDFFAL